MMFGYPLLGERLDLPAFLPDFLADFEAIRFSLKRNND